MKSKLLLWLLLLCSGSAWAQTQTLRKESFETDGEGTRYTSTTTVNTVSVNRYFFRAKDPVMYNGAATFGNSGSVQMALEDSTYFWACEGVRGTSSGSTSTVGPGTLTLRGISNTQTYTDLQVTVAFGDPRDGTTDVTTQQHMRIQYRYGTTGGFTMAGEFTRGPSVSSGAVSPWTRVGGTGTAATLTSAFSDHTFDILAGSGDLYVQIEADYYGSNKEIAFDNIRVTGKPSTVLKPTIASNVGTGTLTFVEGTAARLTVFSDLAVANPAMTSSPMLTGATVSIATGYAGTEDELTYGSLPTGITLASNTGQVLTFSGTASVASYEALLESIQYKNTDPNNATAGNRKLSFIVKSTVDSAPLERIITVTTALNGPTLLSSLPNSTYIENFDTDGEGTRYGSNTKVSNSQGFVRLTNASNGNAAPGSGFSGAASTVFTNVQGAGYWYTNGTQGIVSGGVGQLTLAPVNSAGFVNLHFKVRVGAFSSGGGFTSNEFLRFSYSTDGGTTWTIFANYTGASGQLYLNGNTATPFLDTSLDNVDFALPASLNGATISFRAETNNGGGEQIVFDDIQITGVQQATVNSIVRASANPTNAATVNYTVTFSSAVTGLTASNFSLTTTGTVSGTVGTPVVGAGNTWTVPVTGITGSGTLTLSLTNDNNLSVDITTTLPFAGETYTIDKTAPTVVSSVRQNPATATTGATSLTFRVTFSEAVTGVTTSSFTFVTATGSTTGSIASVAAVSGSNGTQYDVTVNRVSGNGTVRLDVKSSGSGISDAVGNGLSGGFTGGETYTVNQSVTVTSVTRLTPSPTATAQVSYRVVFSGSVSGVTANNFSVTSNTGAGIATNGVSGSGTTYTVVVNTGTGDGTLTLNVVSSTGITPTVSNVPYTAGETYTITKGFAAAPTLRIQAAGSASGNSDVTAFVDVVQVLQSGTSNVVANGLQNGSFETNNVPANGFRKASDATPVVAAPWSFTGTSGVARYGSLFDSQVAGFTQPLPPNGDAVALVQSVNGNNNANISQNLAVPTGSYQVRFQTIQRYYTAVDQRLNVFINDVFVGSIQPNNTPTYETFTSASFNVFAPVLTATITSSAGSNGGSTTTSPIPFTVTFSQSVTGFDASDVTVGNGSLSGFSGSGSTYTFNVTPSANGAVTVNVLANAAVDANNTSNSSASFSITYAQPVTAAPVVTAPANGSLTNNPQPTYAGTAPANSTVTVYVGPNAGTATAIGTTTADASGNFTLTQPSALTSGTYKVYATAQTSGSVVSANSNTNTFTVDTTRPTVTLSSSSPSGSTNVAAPFAFTATFTEPVTGFVAGDLSVSNGTVTSFSGSGTTYTFTVTPTVLGSVTSVAVFANSSQDAANNGNVGSANYLLTSSAPTITLAPATLPDGAVGTAYNQTLTASGGTAPYTYAITAGALPAGLTLSSAGVLSGTPTAGGSFSFTVRATDASAAPGPYSGSRAYTLLVAAPIIVLNPPTLPGGMRGTAYSQALSASGGTAPYTYAITAGALPAGLTLSSAGVLSGTPAASGSFSFTVTATDASTGDGPYFGLRSYTLTIAAPTITLAPATLPNGTVAVAYSQTLTASGGTAPYTYAITAGALPAGLTLSSAGVLAGTPAAGGTFNFTVTATDASTSASGGPYAALRSYSLVIAAPTIVVSPASLPSGTQGTAYSQTLTASGGTAPYTYAITAGALPAGLSLTNGTISGTPAVNGTFTFTVTATDASTGSGPYTGSRPYSLSIAVPVVTSVSWNGNINTDWFNASNWSPNQVPDATLDAVIPTSPSGGRFPTIVANASPANARNLSIASGASLTMTANTLVLAANLTNNGTFSGFSGSNGGTLVLGGSAPALLNGGGVNRFWNLTVGANGAQLNNPNVTSVRRLLALNGNFATNSNPFTLISDAARTAMVVNNGGNVVNGDVTVQRYIDPSLNPNLGYRHVSAPIANATVASLTTSGFSPVVNPAYNASPTPLLVQSFPTVYGYDQARLASTNNNLNAFDKGWYSPSALTDALNVGQGYTVLIGGGQTWNFTGPLNNGNRTVTLARNSDATAPDAGYALVGNPYPSPLDWRQVSLADRPNVGGTVYVYQSNDPANPYTGVYGFYSASANIGTVSPVLAQGQGFFVRVDAGQTAGAVTFRNSQRPTTYTSPTYLRTTETRPLVELHLQGTGSTLSDAAFVYFEQGATDSFDAQFDAEKLPNPSGLNLSTSLSATQRLAIDGRAPLGTTQRVVPLAVGVPAVGSYTLSTAQLLNLGTTPVYLRDLQSGAVIDLRQQASYSFTVSNASALITSRFELVFSPQAVLATAPAALAAQVGLYPNPATTTAFVELPTALGRSAVAAELVDALGRTMRKVSLPAQGAAPHRLDLANLATGVYTLHLRTGAGVIVKKLVVE
ncbi:putative Ig domain-containing protein [Hymenobacter monticola]|uniref:Ig domain-containing protein n=1 Tax=Hymenobacter monticola TaxID=1705399 RepID=A0ABY4AYZ9_9BACT|nr:putative Ig domain-containing protein [Hymenobacter monticola]UOE32135.1 putative Ig domain-containing protein [Hymenobacter monticola]